MNHLAQRPTEPSYRSLGPTVIEVLFPHGDGSKEAASTVAASGKTPEHARSIQAKLDACTRVGLVLNGEFYFTVDNITEVLSGKQYSVTITVYSK